MDVIGFALALNGGGLLIVALLLLFPLYLKDKGSKYYRGGWRLIGETLGNRFGAFSVLIPLSSMLLANMVFAYSKNFLTALGTVIILNFLFSLALLWFPYYLRDKKPERYKGVWKAIGDWLGEPKVRGKKS